MKVLVAHNRYQSDAPSGENIVVDTEIDVLRRNGVEVIPFIRTSDAIEGLGALDKVGVALGPVRNPRGVHDFSKLIASSRPDVVHVHNVYPLISPWIVREAKAQNIPVVMTVHNFRLDCVAGTYLRGGKVCTECTGRSVATPALRHGCYRGSHLQTIPMVVGRSVHRSTWRGVDRFIALTDFHAEFLTSMGIPLAHVVIRPTSVNDPGEPTAPGRDLLFLGRLGEEKGLKILLEAWELSSAKTSGRRLNIVGDGELRRLTQSAVELDNSITWHGSRDRQFVDAQLEACGVVVIPSTCFEGFPRTLAEGFAHGRPIIASAIGGLGRIVNDDVGWLTGPGDATELALVIDNLDDAAILARGSRARRRFLNEFSETATSTTLLDVYREVTTQP